MILTLMTFRTTSIKVLLDLMKQVTLKMTIPMIMMAVGFPILMMMMTNMTKAMTLIQRKKCPIIF
jgi:hypothetical protein